MNLASLLEGPAFLTHLGVPLHFRGGLTVTPLADVFGIEGDTHDSLDQRAMDNSVIITGTPVGLWTATQIAALWRTAGLGKGRLVTPRYDISAISTETDVVTLLGSAVPRTGCPVRIVAAPGATLPAAITGTTTYYWSVTGKLYTTQAHAEADTGASLIEFADDGDGDLFLIEQEDTVIDATTINRRLTFHNTAIISPPPVILSATQTALGQLSIACFRKEGAAWADANSFYTDSKVALSDTPPTAASIPTQEYSCVFGAAPWDAFKARGPITITPTIETTPVTVDGRGLLGMQIASRGITAQLSPAGFSPAQLRDLLGLQGGSVGRGASRVRGDLVVSGTGVHCTLYNGAPRALPQTFQTTGPLAGALEITGHQETDGTLFRFATAAP